MISSARINARSTRPESYQPRVGGRAWMAFMRSGGVNPAISLWQALINSVAPLGYEDDRGFHFGVAPRDDG